MPKLQNEAQSKEQIPVTSSSSPVSDANSPKEHPFIQPDELPKSQEDLDEEEREKILDSPYTKMLRQFSIFTSSREWNYLYVLDRVRVCDTGHLQQIICKIQ